MKVKSRDRNTTRAGSANVRGITKKIDEIQQIADLNNVATETWLSSNVTDSTVAIQGYNIFWKARVTTIEVCIYLNSKIPCKRLEQCNEDGVESLSISLRPFSLPRDISSIILSVIYHTTSTRKPENVVLQQHIQRNLDNILANQPNALVMIMATLTPFQLDELFKMICLRQAFQFQLKEQIMLNNSSILEQAILVSWIGS